MAEITEYSIYITQRSLEKNHWQYFFFNVPLLLETFFQFTLSKGGHAVLPGILILNVYLISFNTL